MAYNRVKVIGSDVGLRPPAGQEKSYDVKLRWETLDM